MTGEGFRVVKDEARTRAGFVALDHRPAFIKRYDAGSWAEGLLERARGSRAARSLKGAALLAAAGFAHPEPLAALELSRAGAIRSSYLMSEALAEARRFSAFLDRGVDARRRNLRWRRATLGAVAAEVKRLHDAGLCSSDLQETNLMLEETAGGLKVYFVDLDGIRRMMPLPWPSRMRNLVQLDRSIGRFLSRTERLGFLYAYLGRRPTGAEARKLVGQMLAERERKERQYQRRRARRAGGASGGAELLGARAATGQRRLT